ncbi:oligosaccharide flippase family protein [Neolewinella persica]|uniref:oligosaccharide flippase family protein n=1 Tax=Neolewinella persica TaxID=70998 RepID=UPI00036CA21A|nr:oligosaccharide flippase family protein [Neolewinella persica]
MVGQFFRNALLQVSLNLLVKGVYLFAVERVVQNILPEGDYGLYFALLGLGMLLQVVADFGLQLYNSRVLAGHRQLLAKYFPYFIGLKLMLGTAFFLLLLPIGYLLGYRAAEVQLLLIAGAVQFFNSLVLYLRSNLSGLGKYALDGWFSILDKSLMILTVGGILLYVPEELTILRFAGLQLMSWAVTAALLVLVVRDRLPRKLPKFSRATFMALLKGGAPYALAVFLATAYTRTDAIMIERLLADGPAAADHYAASYRLLDALNMIGWLLAGLLIPMYARLYAQKESLLPLLKFSVQLLLAGSVCAAIPLALYCQEIVELLYDFAEPRTGQILFFLAFSFVAQCLNYAYGALLSATGFIGRMNKIYAVGIALNLGGNLLVLPYYGAPGAAAVTLLTQGFVAVTQAALAHRWLSLPAKTIAWGRLLLFTALLASCGLALNQLVELSVLSWLPACLLLGFFGLALTAVLKLIDFRKLLELAPGQQ